MQDLRSRLIEATVRPLEDSAEMKAAAEHLLERVVPPDANGAEQVIRRLDEVDRKKRGLWWLLPWVLLAVISVGVITTDHREIRRYVAWRSWFGGKMGTMFPAQDRHSTELTHRQKLLLGRDEDPFSRSGALWRDEPGNPAFFAEYACLYMQDNRALPPDFLETARRIDPDNALFTYLAASVEGHESVEQGQDGSWKILDQQRFDRATALIREALSQSRYQSYAGEMMRLRLTEFPVRSRMEQMDLIMGISHHPSPNLKHYQVIGLMLTRCRMAAESGDRDTYLQCAEDAGHLISGMVRDTPGTMLSSVIIRGMVIVLAKELSDGATKLGLQEEAARWKGLHDRVLANKEAGKSRVLTLEDRPGDPKLMAGTLFGYGLETGVKISMAPPVLRDNNLEPGRLQDHEILSRLCCYLSWVLMAVCLIGSLAYRFRATRLGWRLAQRMESLLGWNDWIWIVAAGVLLPLFFVGVMNRFTPLGGRQFGMIGTGLLLPAIHFLGLVVIWLIASAQVTRWRLARLAGPLGFTRAPLAGWLALACAAAFIPASGWAVISRSYPPLWVNWMSGLDISLESSLDHLWLSWTAIALLAISLLWICTCVFHAFFGRTEEVMRRATSIRILAKPMLAAMILLGLATVALKASERYWFARDRIERADPVKPGWTAFEHDMSTQLHLELREILADAP